MTRRIRLFLILLCFAARLMGMSALAGEVETQSKNKNPNRNSNVNRTRSLGESRSEAFSVSPGGTLDVSSEVGSILISVWEKNQVVVRVQGIDPDDLDQVRMTQFGSTVRVEYHSDGRRPRRMRFEVSIPSHFNLDLRTGGGDIELQGPLTGDLRGKTSGGDVILADVSGRVDISTSGGDIRTDKIQGEGYLKTSGGDIRVEMVGGNMDVHTSGGNIIVGNVGKTLRAQTAGGDIEIGNVGGEATVSTAGGNIQVGKVSGSATLKTAGGDIELNGGSGIISAITAGGNITLDNVSGSVEARTVGGDVTAALRPSGQGRSRLTTTGGEVTLYLPANAKATIEARIRIQGYWKRGKRYNQDYEIRSDFKADSYEQDDRLREIRATYTLNGGGETIWLETIEGNIEIRKLESRPRQDER